MGMPDNSKWTTRVDGVDMWTDGEQLCDVSVSYVHEDGRSIQHTVLFTLMGDVQVNGERPGHALDGFVSIVDESYERAISEAGEDDTVERSFFIFPDSEIMDPIDADGDVIDIPNEYSQVEDGWINLEYAGPYETDDKALDAEIENALQIWGKNLAERVHYTTDFDQVWGDLTAA